MTRGAILSLNKDPDEGTLHPHYRCRSPASLALLIFANLLGRTPVLPLSVISVCGAPAMAPTSPPPPGSGCRKAGGTNVGWPCPGRTQPAGSGGGHRKTQWKKNDSVVCVCVCVCVIVRGRFWIDFQNLFTPPNLLVLCLESPLQPRTLQIFLFLSSGIASLISIVDPMWNLF